MLLILSPRYPHLVKRPQARQYAPADPAAEPPLRQIPRRLDPHPRPRKSGHELLIQPLREPADQTRPACDDHIRQEVRSDIDVHGCQGGLDALDDGLVGQGLRVRGVLEGHFGVEEAFDGAEAVERGEEGVPAVGHLKGFAQLGLRDFNVGCALWAMTG